MKMRKFGVLLALCCVFMILASCGGGSGASNGTATGNNPANPEAPTNKKANTPPKEPVKLLMSKYTNGTTKADFENFYKPFLDKKLSGISVEFINDDGLEKQFAAGIVPDLVTAGFAQIPSITKLDYAADLTALAKKNNVDLSKYNQVALNGAKIYSLQGQLNAIPHKISTFGLFYNKDLFDKFGVTYPKDDMTWEEATEIARKVSRTDGSNRYSGLQYSNNIAVFSRGVGLTLVDPKTNKAAFNNDKALKVLSVLHGIYTVPGNEWQAKILDRFLAGETA